MKEAFFVLILVSSAFAVISPIYREWDEWKRQYKPNYVSNAEEEKRMKIFAQNRRTVLKLNKQYEDDPGELRFALNRFADLIDEEFAATYLRDIATDIPRAKYLPRLLHFPCLLISFTIICV